MKKVYSVFSTFSFVLLLSASIFAVYYDSGYIEFQQPNGTTFIGREWGDEFLFQKQTQDGYHYVLASDGWYYYALPDDSLGFVASNDTVGINPPPVESYNIQLSAAYMAKIEQARNEFLAAVEANMEFFQQRQGEARVNGEAVELRIGILLVEFQDTTHYTTLPPPFGNREYGYLIEDFDRMFFSDKNNSNYNWYAPNDSFASPHPEGHAVFGSFRDYWWEVSRGDVDSVGALRITGSLINPPDSLHPAVPQWIQLDSAKSYYNDHGGHEAEGIFKAKDKGWLQYEDDLYDPYDFVGYDKIAVIYAGRVQVNHLWPSTYIRTINDKGFWDMCELGNAIFFNHIGIHLHENGHTIGMPDEYEGVKDFFDLMNFGPQNGPRIVGECPAMIAPYYRIEKYQWAEAIEITAGDTTDLIIDYNYQNPPYYKVASVVDTTKYFILENRGREGFDMYTPLSPDSMMLQGGSLLIWKVNQQAFGIDRINLVHADNKSLQNRSGDFFPKSPILTSQSLNQFTIPSSTIGNSVTYIGINNIRKFSADTTKMIMDINRYVWLIPITGNTTWQGSHTMAFSTMVESGATLTIQPGTDVYANGLLGTKPQLIINSGGTLNAIGTEAYPITFYSNGDPNGWLGILFKESSTFDLLNVAVKDANIAFDFSEMELNQQNFEGLKFEDCNNAFLINGDQISFSNIILKNIFEQNCFGDDYSFQFCQFINSRITLASANSFENAHFELFECIGDSSSISLNHADNTSFIRNSTFMNSSEVNLAGSFLTLESNQFLSGSHLVIYQGSPVIKNNLAVGDGSPAKAIKIFGDAQSQPEIVNNTIVSYAFGIFSENNRGIYAVPDIRNNILYLNDSTSSSNGNLQGNGSATYNNIRNKDSLTYVLPDSTNISDEPLFVNLAAGDFHLEYHSPSIDAGDQNDDYSNEPEPNGGRINQGHYGNTPEATGSFDVIAENDLAANATWSGNVIIVEDISTRGYSLTVEPGTKVFFEDGKVLTITGDFICEGIRGGEPDTIIFRGYRPADLMGGVAVDYGDLQHELRLRYAAFHQGETGLFLQNVSSAENSFEHLEFSGNATGLYAHESSVEISASNFFDNETGLTAKGADLILVECEFDGNSTEGLYLLDSQFRVTGCTFRDNGLRGVYFEYSSEGDFYENTLTGNGYSTVNTQAKGGLVFYQSSPPLSGNRVTENKAPGMVSFSSSYPLMVEPGYNLVAQNAREGSENPPEIQVYDISFPILDYGFNDIVDSEGGYLLHREGDEREIIVYVRENYWGSSDSLEIASRLYPPDSYHFSPFSRSWNTGGLGFAKGTGQDGNALAEALQAERDSNYTAAIALYDSLANAFPLLAESKAALERLYYLKLKAGEPVANVKACFDNLSSHPDTALATVAKRLAIRCLTYAEDYQAAITEHAAWAQATPYFCDSVYSEIDILTNELFAGGGWFGKATGLNGAGGKAAGSGRPGSNGGITSAQYLKAQQVQLAQCRQETERLLNLLLEPGTRQTSLLIPQEFALLQNYPNPFNPSTTIEYHLPFDSQVKIEIYNILGQRVKILVDQREKAGKYKIAWDGRNESGNRAASGMYVYRIKAESLHKTFVTAKKMILLK